jgi:hypothetical protein
VSTNEQISKAVSLFRTSRAHGDEGIYRKLVAEGVEPQLAARLVEFLPLTYGRFLLEKSGTRFSEYFQRMLSSGRSEELLLSSEPVWNAAVAFAPTEAIQGISVQDFLAVAGRSGEFQVANKLLNQGSKLQDLVFTLSFYYAAKMDPSFHERNFCAKRFFGWLNLRRLLQSRKPQVPLSGSNSVVESRLPKPLVAGSIPVSRSNSLC